MLQQTLYIKPLIVSILGHYLTNAERALFLKYPPVRGFILYSHNIRSNEQLDQLTTSLKDLYIQSYHYQPLIITDQEGGRVQRVKPPLVQNIYPAASSFGEMYDKEGPEIACAKTQQNYSDIMRELKIHGIDSPIAPVADLLYAGAHDVIGNRSFGGSVDKAVDLCAATIKGILDAGGIPVMKHIPGHGRAVTDSHDELPRVTASLEELYETDFAVFKQLSAKFLQKSKNSKPLWAMTAHVIYECLDNENPATLSPKVINFIRRKETQKDVETGEEAQLGIGFNGIVISDEICMSALHPDHVKDKYRIAKKVLNKINEKITLSKDDDINPLLKYGIIQKNDDDDYGPQKIQPSLTQALPQLETSWFESLIKAAKLALEAGCDYVLYYSYSIEETTKLLAEIPEQKYIDYT